VSSNLALKITTYDGSLHIYNAKSNVVVPVFGENYWNYRIKISSFGG
jgi:hypothetical protein